MDKLLSSLTKKPISNACRPHGIKVSKQVMDNRPELKKTRSILKHSITLVPCHPAWLPETDAHMEQLEPKEPTVSAMNVWFPEDSTGEPNPKNYDDFGGSKYKLSTIHKYPKIKKNKKEKRSKNLSGQAYRWLSNQIQYGNLNDFNRKMLVWTEFDKRMKKITNPEYDYIGLGWRALFKKKPRIEE